MEMMMTMSRYIALDIETANLDMEVEGLQFGNPAGWKTSCVCIYDFWIDEGVEKGMGYFYADGVDSIIDIDPSLVGYAIKPLETLESDLRKYHSQDYTLVTKNGLGFDLPILSKHISDGGANCNEIIATFEDSDRHIDICQLLRDQYGLRFSLASLVSGLYGTKGMAAAAAPIQWAEKQYQTVLDYCMQDSVLTAKVFVDAPTRSFEAVGKRDGRSQVMMISPSWR